MHGFATEDELRAALAEAQAGSARTGRPMNAEAEAFLVTALRGGLADDEYARLDADGWDLD